MTKIRIKLLAAIILAMILGLAFNGALSFDRLMDGRMRSALMPCIQAARNLTGSAGVIPCAPPGPSDVHGGTFVLQLPEQGAASIPDHGAPPSVAPIMMAPPPVAPFPMMAPPLVAPSPADPTSPAPNLPAPNLPAPNLPGPEQWRRAKWTGDGKGREPLYVRHEGHYLIKLRRPDVIIAAPAASIDAVRQDLFRHLVRAATLTAGVCGLIALLLAPMIQPSHQQAARLDRKGFAAIFSVLLISQLAMSGWIFRAHLAQSDPVRVTGAYWNLMLDAATVLIITLFFLVEMLIFLSQIMARSRSMPVRTADGGAEARHGMGVPDGIDSERSGSDGIDSERSGSGVIDSDGIDYALVRPVIFLLMFGVEMSLSFVPLYMEMLYEPIAGLSRELVLSLPVSVSVFFTGAAFLLAGAWTDRGGWHYPFFGGVLVAGIGLLYAWRAPNALHFIIARAVSGTGYGLFFMAAQGFIIIHTDQRNKARGFASLFAALYAGIICGNATGAMLVDRIGYRPVFLVGAVIVLSAIPFSLLFMRHVFGRSVPSAGTGASSGVSSEASSGASGMRRLLRFVTDRNVFAIILLSSIPANMAMIGFLNYFNPIYLNHMNVSTANIGRIFMIYGFFMIYGGPFFSRFVDRSGSKKMVIVIGGVVGSAAFLSFHFFTGVAASLVAVTLLGISQSFVFVTQAAYLLKLQTSRALGEGAALGAFRFMSRMGQALGPMIFGALTVSLAFNTSVVCFGAAYLVLTLLFLAVARSDRRIAAADG